MELHIGMSEEHRQKISDELARILADCYALYLKTQNFHWNITCSDFYALHLLFEKQYEELAEELDEIAERIRALGYFVDATFSGFKKLTSIPEEDKVLNAKDMITALAKGHEIITRQARHTADLAEKYKDQATIDMLGRRMAMHEKAAWMLRCHL